MVTTVGTGAVMATKKMAFGSSLLGSMVIFQDPAYFFVAGIGAFVSVGSAYYDITKVRKAKEAKGEECLIDTKLELGKAFFVGGIFSILSFMLFLQSGGEAMNSVTGAGWFGKLLPSFWLVFTVALSTEAPLIWDGTWGRAKLWITGNKKTSDESKESEDD